MGTLGIVRWASVGQRRSQQQEGDRETERGRGFGQAGLWGWGHVAGMNGYAPYAALWRRESFIRRVCLVPKNLTTLERLDLRLTPLHPHVVTLANLYTCNPVGKLNSNRCSHGIETSVREDEFCLRQSLVCAEKLAYILQVVWGFPGLACPLTMPFSRISKLPEVPILETVVCI